MSWDKEGNLYCNCCHNIVIPKNEVTKKDLDENTGKTFCEDCCIKFGGPFEKFVKEYYEKKKNRG